MKVLFRPTGVRTLGTLCALTVAAGVPAAAWAGSAAQITGTAHNQSRGQAATGDEVILLLMDAGMKEETRAKTDALGAFSFDVQHPDKPYLVRVVHQGVNYDQAAVAGDALSIQVFDAAARVQGVSASIEILRAGTNAEMLHVSDMYEIKNEANPPLTQVGERTFEVSLPASAKMDSVLAAGPGNIAGMISASPVPGQPGHYAVTFPLRPGLTKFAFNYDVPYTGRVTFQTWHANALQQLAVMIPPSMKFSTGSHTLQVLATGSRKYQVEVANQLAAGVGPKFEVSGFGEIPPLGDQTKTQVRSEPLPLSHPAVAPAVADHIVTPTWPRMEARSRPAQPVSQSLVLSGVGAALLAGCVFLVWRGRRRSLAPN